MLLYRLITCRSFKLTLRYCVSYFHLSLVTYPHSYVAQAWATWLTTHRNAALWWCRLSGSPAFNIVLNSTMGAASSVSLSTQSWVQVEMESSTWRLTSCTEWAVLDNKSPYLQQSHVLVISSVCLCYSSCGFWVFVLVLWISWWLMGSAIWVVVFQGHGAGCWASHMVPWSSREWDTMKPLLQWRNVKLGHTKGVTGCEFQHGRKLKWRSLVTAIPKCFYLHVKSDGVRAWYEPAWWCLRHLNPFEDTGQGSFLVECGTQIVVSWKSTVQYCTARFWRFQCVMMLGSSQPFWNW